MLLYKKLKATKHYKTLNIIAYINNINNVSNIIVFEI